MSQVSTAYSIELIDPPLHLECNVMTLKAGTIIHRVHDRRFAACQFNPGFGSSRFAPIKQFDEKPIPTIYASTTFSCAIYESLFHDIEPTALFKTVFWRNIEKLNHSEVELARDINLAKLFSADLMKWNCSRGQLIDTPPSSYIVTRQWAVRIHESNPHIDGMIWTSRKFDQDKAMILFGTRMFNSDLHEKFSTSIGSNPADLHALQSLAKDSNIIIVR